MPYDLDILVHMTALSSNLWIVFISHCSEDSWVAKQISKAIESRGAQSFLDVADIAVGQDFEDKILEMLNKANELVVILTPWALDRPYIWAEMGAAWGRRIPIIGLLYGINIQELKTRPDVPVFLTKRDIIRLNDLDIYLEQLEVRVTTSLSKAED